MTEKQSLDGGTPAPVVTTLADWKQEALLELAIALSFIPWHGVVVLLAAHLAFITAGGGK